MRVLVPLAVLAVAGAIGLFLLVRLLTSKPPIARRGGPEEEAVAAEPPIHGAALRGPVTPVEAAVDAQVQTTHGILTARGRDCAECAERNGCLDPTDEGSLCEMATGMATGCGAGVTEKDMCMKTLMDVFTSKCAETLQETPCLCGTTDVIACLQGTEPPTGPAYHDYACDFNTTKVEAIQGSFVERRFGAGQANALIQCVAAYECKCFGN